MPVKAPPPASPFVLDVHGFFDMTFASTRVTGGGLYLYPNGTLVQPAVGLSLDVYKNSSGFINSFSVYGGIWNEAWTSPPAGRKWQEMDWWAGFSVGFAQHWKFSAEYLEFVFPSGLTTAQNLVFTLAYDDSHWGLPFTINPYVSLFYNIKSASTVVFGDTTDTYRVTLGVVPTINLEKSKGIPLTISAPTSVVVGPSSFWNRNDGTTNVCGPAGTLPCELSNARLRHDRPDGQVSAHRVHPETAGYLVRQGGRSLLPHLQRCVAGGAGWPSVRPRTSQRPSVTSGWSTEALASPSDPSW